MDTSRRGDGQLSHAGVRHAREIDGSFSTVLWGLEPENLQCPIVTGCLPTGITSGVAFELGDRGQDEQEYGEHYFQTDSLKTANQAIRIKEEVTKTDHAKTWIYESNKAKRHQHEK